MKNICRITALALVMLICLSVFAVSAFAAEPQSIVLSARVTASGTYPLPVEEYTVVLEPTDSSNPMPEGSKDGVYKLVLYGAGKKSFPAITFDTLGVYQYKIYQKMESAPYADYDDTVYTATVYVLNSETQDDAITVTVVLNRKGSDEKPDEVVFKNR